MKKFLHQQLLPFVDPIGWVSAMRDAARSKRSMRLRRAEGLRAFRQKLSDILNRSVFEKAQLALFPSTGVLPVAVPDLEVDLAREMIQWSDADLVSMHDGLVKDTLIKLRDTSAKSVRRELFQWFAPDAQHEKTFSLESCCAIAGLHADDIRRQVFRIYRDEILSLIADEQYLLDVGRNVIRQAVEA